MLDTQSRSSLRLPPEILTVSGNYFDFLTPSQSEFTIEDIAHGLSHVCRFAGHSREFYSVAQHCVLVSKIVPQHMALIGLMHDATEAFLGDVTSPLKQLIPQYKEVEARVERAIFDRFGLQLPLPQEVKRADMIALATEQRDLMPPHDPARWTATAGLTPLAETIIPLSPADARIAFLMRYAELTFIARYGEPPREGHSS